MNLRYQLCCAHPKEATAVTQAGLGAPWILGVGKVPSAVSLMQHLLNSTPRPDLLILVGVAGVYPSNHRRKPVIASSHRRKPVIARELPSAHLNQPETAPEPSDHRRQPVIARELPNAHPPPNHPPSPPLKVGDLCLVHTDRWLDEGVQCETEFLDLDALSLRGDEPSQYFAHPQLNEYLARRMGIPRVCAATVSCAAGCDRLSRAYAGRGAEVIESMEGAAVAHVAHVLKIPWIGIRAISNRCGDRQRAGWDLDGALHRLSRGVAELGAIVADPRIRDYLGDHSPSKP